ncbi:hypothetical protein AB1N83_012425 [Pleurotus pulmonarius]
MCKHILNAQVSIRAPCCKQWYDCAECHAESQSHNLRKTTEMAFMCKKCKKAFRKDMSNYEESDEFCPHCDNHYVIEAKTPQAVLGVEGEDARVDARMIKDERVKPVQHARSAFLIDDDDLADRIGHGINDHILSVSAEPSFANRRAVTRRDPQTDTVRSPIIATAYRVSYLSFLSISLQLRFPLFGCPRLRFTTGALGMTCKHANEFEDINNLAWTGSVTHQSYLPLVGPSVSLSKSQLDGMWLRQGHVLRCTGHLVDWIAFIKLTLHGLNANRTNAQRPPKVISHMIRTLKQWCMSRSASRGLEVELELEIDDTL